MEFDNKDWNYIEDCTYGIEADLGDGSYHVILIQEKPEQDIIEQVMREMLDQPKVISVREMTFEEVQEFIAELKEIEDYDEEEEEDKWNVETWNPDKWDSRS